MKIYNYLLLTGFFLSIVQFSFGNYNPDHNFYDPFAEDFALITQDTIPPLEDRTGNFSEGNTYNPFDLKDPSIIEQNVEYDPVSGQYIITETIGDDYYRMPSYMTFDEYLDWRTEQQEKAYFDKLAGISNANNAGGERVDPISKVDVKNSLVDRLFGGVGVDIRPQGNIDLTFGVDFQNVENPILTERQRRQGGFDFDMGIQMNVIGKIGDKLNLATSYNTQATFNFENRMKLEYDSEQWSEDEIIKKIEAGNVSFPLNSQLIQGSQSLFGLRVDTQWGKLKLKAVASQQKSKRENIKIDGGAQEQTFEVFADEYDENRHFFLTHYFRDVFENSLRALPEVNSLVKITNLQVWVTNDRNDTEQIRDIVALADIGEPTRITNNNPQFQAPTIPVHRDLFGTAAIPANDANPLFDALISNPNARSLNNAVAVIQNNFGFTQTKDFEKVSARKLNTSEYTFNPDLGFVSININLRPDQVLGVAFEYDYNGQTYKVGELADDTPNSTPADSTSVSNELNVLFVKMLKSTTPRVDLPTWDLMMKNVYSIGAFQVNREDFILDIFYEDPGGGEKRFLPESNLASVPLLRVFNLDDLNVQGDPQPDGIFDFVPDVTINLRNGRVMFPVLEPFGSAIADQIDDPQLKRRYSYYELYDSTVIRAREFPEYNRFTIRGSYKSSVSSEISLGSFNLPQGSVRVSAGGYQLVEGQDYEVDYNIGRVKILNDALLNSGVPINISFEDNTLFGFQTKTLLGLRADYEVSKNFNIGGTYMHLYERPFTQKVNIGDDPINNRVFGLDVNYSKESPWLTKMVDKIPLINTKEKSNISFMAEAAYLKPGHARAIDLGEDENGNQEKGGVVYVDDFEGSASSYDLRTPANAWVLSSIPQNDENNNNPLFPESKLIDDLESGMNRAKLNWYRIDQSIRSTQDQDDPYAASIRQDEVFPNLQLRPGDNNIIQTFDLTFDPTERGPYNFDVPGGGQYSAGINPNGLLLDPETRWGGIMRDLNTNNFEQANIEYVEFWMLNPFMAKGDGSPVTQDGNLYINLGNVSEDILRDSRKFFENGIPPEPTTPTDTTTWGRIPRTQAITNAFNNEESVRQAQDVGLDGLNNVGERAIFQDYLTQINASNIENDVKDAIVADPSNDDFRYFRDESFTDQDGIFQRYRDFNNPEGNSQSSAQTGQLSSATNLPDTEDINNDNTLSETESYFQYKVPIEQDNGILKFNNFIIDTIQGFENRIWYRVKIPLDQPTKRVGGIQDFRSIRFIRMYMHGFDERVTLRFARLELVRNQWRRYLRNSSMDGPQPPNPFDNSTFDVNAVNIEENSTQEPFGYVLPPGISRERSIGAFPDVLQNEQSLSMEICNLPPRNFKAIFKTVNLDMRVFNKLQMNVHAESKETIDPGKLSIFMRLGSDFENNYYEYEIPLVMSEGPTAPYNSDEYKLEVWREENEFDFVLELFKEVKIERNQLGKALNEVHFMPDPEKTANLVKVVGNPNLNLVKGVMVGIYNNDNLDHCTEVWINELRLNGLDERGGLAAVSRLDMQLADFGNLSASVNYSTRGYGDIGQKLAQRSREEVLSYDIAGSAELSKFFPEKWGLRLPFYGQYSNTVRTPEFDPYDRDIPLKEKLASEQNLTARDSLREQAVDATEIKSWNITNARKERTNKDAVPMPWDISNFSFTYAYTETTRHDPIIELDQIDDHYASIDYAYNLKPKYITPFKKLSKNKHLKLITDLNFNLVPNTIGVNTQMDRQIQATRYRFAGPDPKLNTYYNKQFTWDRNYNLNWDLTKNLKLRFNAINEAIIDELPTFDGDVPVPQQQQKDFIMDNIRDLGRTKNYRHDVNASYTVPFKSIPLLDWVTVKAQYSADYAWNGSSLLAADTLGNIIQNGQTRQINADLNFEQLYNKSKYLKKINKKNSGKSKKGRKTSRGGDDDGGGVKDGGKGKDRGARGGRGAGGKVADLSRGSIKDKMDTPSIKDRISGKDGKGETGKDGSGTGVASADGKSGKKGKDGKKKKDPKDKKKKKEREPTKIERIALRPLMLLRKARASYTENLGTTIPGYQRNTKFFGMDDGFSAPGWDFVGGLQPDITDNDFSNDWLTRSANNGWITDNVFQNKQVLQNYSQNIDGRITIEPFNDFRVEIEANRSYTENSSLYFRDTTYDTTPGNYEDIVHTVPRDVGSYTISYFTLQTLFDDDLEGLFKNFEANRLLVSDRLGTTGAAHEDDPQYSEGYGRYQRDVLIPSFLAAYSDKDASTFELDVFKTLPKLNWRLTYNGLAKLDMFKNIFSSMSLSHSYKSTMTVNSFETDRDFDPAAAFNKNPTTNNYYSRFDIPQIVISEQFAPLIGLDMKLKNDMTLRADWKKSRNLAMSFIDNRLNETKTSEFVIGYGYRMKDVYLAFLYGKKGKKKKKKKKPAKGNVSIGTPDADADKGKKATKGSDLNFKFDISYRDDVTYLFILDEDIIEPTRGSQTIRISPSIDYDVNKRLNIRLFYDYSKTVPKTSASFPITNTQAGVTIRFSLD